MAAGVLAMAAVPATATLTKSLRFIWIYLFNGLEQRKDERIGFENLAAKVLLGCGSAHSAPLSGQWGWLQFHLAPRLLHGIIVRKPALADQGGRNGGSGESSVAVGQPDGALGVPDGQVVVNFSGTVAFYD
jgi:hypothetical protein